MNGRRSFLFLQGMATQFFGRLGRTLAERGHNVHRINFNGGDSLFWPLCGAVDYRQGLAEWPKFLEERLVGWSVTDIILFGDCRPLHRAAVRVAMLRGVQVHVFDEGYLRPHWVTMEHGGVNGYSSMPRDPDWFCAAAQNLPVWRPAKPVDSSFFRRASEDVLYNVATVLLSWRFPGYETHRPWHPFVEYAGWLRRFARRPAMDRRLARGLAELAASERPYYFLPLQLDCDSQIRRHSPFGRIAPALSHIIDSFANHAPANSMLVIKEHPLDNGLTDWRALVAQIAESTGVGDRILYLEGGDLEPLLKRSAGVVTVNSTVGFLALAFGRPVVALGDAIYDMPRLTFQQGLNRFWKELTAPDPVVFDAFRRVAVARTQLNGGFFSRGGLELAVAGAVARLEDALRDRRFPAYPAQGQGQTDDVDTLRTASLAL
jgi:capsular polysaccharide export protein